MQRQDGSGKKMTLGISHRCVSVYRRGQRVNGFSWCKIVRLFYKKKHFFTQLQRERVRRRIFLLFRASLAGLGHDRDRRLSCRSTAEPV